MKSEVQSTSASELPPVAGLTTAPGSSPATGSSPVPGSSSTKVRSSASARPSAPASALADAPPRVGESLRTAARWVTAVGFVVAGCLHFVRPGWYVRIIPPELPWPGVLVGVSGFFEVAGGVGLLVPSLRRAAGWGLVALLVCVFPANLYMALHPERFAGIATWLLWLRLPLQGVLMIWVVWVAGCGGHASGESRAGRGRPTGLRKSRNADGRQI